MEKANSKPTNLRDNDAAQRFGRVALSALALLAAYLLASRALDTGSLQQYFLAFVLLTFGINRFIAIFKRKK